jgi:prepilin-type N-terminal cleavage/methylation domain-containing protein
MSFLRREHGFTLIEALVAMAIAVVVFGATLTILEVYMRQSNGVTQRFDAQNQARVAVDRIIRQLRNVASPLTSPKLLERATPYDLVFQTIGSSNGANVAGTERVRYCIPDDTSSGSSSNDELISQTETWSTSSTPADPWSSDPSVTIPCPDTTFAAQPNGVVLASSVVNRYKQTGPPGTSAEQPAFAFNNGTLPEGNSVTASDLSSISTIQVNLWVNPTPKVKGATTEIQSSAYLRNKEHSPVATFTYSAIGNGAVILNAGTSYSPDGQQLSFKWNCTSCSGTTSLSSATDGLVSWQPGAGTYTVTVTVKDQDGLSTTSDPGTVIVK